MANGKCVVLAVDRRDREIAFGTAPTALFASASPDVIKPDIIVLKPLLCLRRIG